MVRFYPVRLMALTGVRGGGWAVKMADDKGNRRIVSELFSTRAKARMEADRLTALKPKKPKNSVLKDPKARNTPPM
jgi:hypothetical protein